MTRGSADGQVEAEIESQHSWSPPGGRLGGEGGVTPWRREKLTGDLTLVEQSCSPA